VIAPTSKTSETDPSPVKEFPTRASILEELERICVNQHFRGSTRGKQFLTYAVQNAIEGRTEMLKERVIGAELGIRTEELAQRSRTAVLNSRPT